MIKVALCRYFVATHEWMVELLTVLRLGNKERKKQTHTLSALHRRLRVGSNSDSGS